MRTAERFRGGMHAVGRHLWLAVVARCCDGFSACKLHAVLVVLGGVGCQSLAGEGHQAECVTAARCMQACGVLSLSCKLVLSGFPVVEGGAGGCRSA